MVLEEVYNVF